MTALCGKFFLRLEHIMGEPIGPRGLQIDYGLKMWTNFQFYVKNLIYFDPKSAQMWVQNDRLMCEKNFFAWNTSWASQ